MTFPILFSTLHLLSILDNKFASLNLLMDFWEVGLGGMSMSKTLFEAAQVQLGMGHARYLGKI